MKGAEATKIMVILYSSKATKIPTLLCLSNLSTYNNSLNINIPSYVRVANSHTQVKTTLYTTLFIITKKGKSPKRYTYGPTFGLQQRFGHNHALLKKLISYSSIYVCIANI